MVIDVPQLVEQAGCFQHGKHVVAVVGGHSVGSERDVDTVLDEQRHGGDTAPELHVGDRVVHHGGPESRMISISRASARRRVRRSPAVRESRASACARAASCHTSSAPTVPAFASPAGGCGSADPTRRRAKPRTAGSHPCSAGAQTARGRSRCPHRDGGNAPRLARANASHSSHVGGWSRASRSISSGSARRSSSTTVSWYARSDIPRAISARKPRSR